MSRHSITGKDWRVINFISQLCVHLDTGDNINGIDILDDYKSESQNCFSVSVMIRGAYQRDGKLFVRNLWLAKKEDGAWEVLTTEKLTASLNHPIDKIPSAASIFAKPVLSYSVSFENGRYEFNLVE